VSIYPKAVEDRILSARAASAETADATGLDAAFACGSFVEFAIHVDGPTKTITDCRFRSNGCGFMVAAADVLASAVRGKTFAALHGLDRDSLASVLVEMLGNFPPERIHCGEICSSALRSAFAHYRSKLIEEFRGEKPLICTCFGVTEETVERIVNETPRITVDEIARQARAGSGCGSCRMLIQEIIDNA
jgi:NifU-like protein